MATTADRGPGYLSALLLAFDRRNLSPKLLQLLLKHLGLLLQET